MEDKKILETTEKTDEVEKKVVKCLGGNKARYGSLIRRLEILAGKERYFEYLCSLRDVFGEIVWGFLLLRSMSNIISVLNLRVSAFANLDKKAFGGWLAKNTKLAKSKTVDPRRLPQNALMGKIYTKLNKKDGFEDFFPEDEEKNSSDIKSRKALNKEFDELLGFLEDYQNSRHGTKTAVKIRKEFIGKLIDVLKNGKDLSKKKIVKKSSLEPVNADKDQKSFVDDVKNFFSKTFKKKGAVEQKGSLGQVTVDKDQQNVISSLKHDITGSDFFGKEGDVNKVYKLLEKVKNDIDEDELRRAIKEVCEQENGNNYFGNKDFYSTHWIALQQFGSGKLSLESLMRVFSNEDLKEVKKDGYINLADGLYGTCFRLRNKKPVPVLIRKEVKVIEVLDKEVLGRCLKFEFEKEYKCGLIRIKRIEKGKMLKIISNIAKGNPLGKEVGSISKPDFGALVNVSGGGLTITF